jgi:DNA-directed RNA polymerase specialized sigma24 family protein
MVAVKSFSATARREGKWWVVDVHGIGATQGRTTTEAERMAKDLVAIMEEIPVDTVDVEIEFMLPGELGHEVRNAREQTRAAEQAQRRAAEKIRQAVAHIIGNGMSKQDAARILGVSPQRISQLVKPT